MIPDLLIRCPACNGGDDLPAVTIPGRVGFSIREICIECKGANYLLTDDGNKIKELIEFLELQKGIR